MQIIPVIDLKDGLVVHAVRGNRSTYQPIHRSSIITRHSDIQSVLTSFLSLYPFQTFYIADLDAIMGTGHHQTLLNHLQYSHPKLNFWIDNGSRLSQLPSNLPGQSWVIGTESQSQPLSQVPASCILSLDFKNEQPAGDSAWFSESQYWPERVIVMTLQRVGSNQGPDTVQLEQLIQRHPKQKFIAAGGIRHHDDLLALQHLGVSATLLATALHHGQITPQALEKF